MFCYACAHTRYHHTRLSDFTRITLFCWATRCLESKIFLQLYLYLGFACYRFRNLCLKESLADWRKLFDTFVKMWSFEGDFRTKPTQSLRGASKKVLFEVGQLLFFNHPWIFFYACVIPFSTSGYLMRWWLPTLPFITAKTCNVKY